MLKTIICRFEGLEMTKGSDSADQPIADINMKEFVRLVRDPATHKVISDAQRRRLFALAREYRLSKEELEELIAVHGFTSTRDITKAAYDQICAEVALPF